MGHKQLHFHAAARERVLDTASIRSILRTAIAIHYADRSWDGVLDAAPVPSAKRKVLGHWLIEGRVDQKRIDARACLNAAPRDPRTVKVPRPPMVRTLFFDALARECGVPRDRPPEAPARAAR